MGTIFQHLEYQSWLKVAFTQKKAETPSFSHRFVSQRLGLKSSGHILYVMQGKRKLTEKLAIELANIFKLSRRETDYFLMLLRYNHAKSSQEKQFHFRQLAALRRRHVKNVEPEQYKFYEKWFYPVIRETLVLKPFSGDYASLAAMITPPITSADAQEAVSVLEKLGFVYRDDKGVYGKKDAVISTGDVWQSAIIHAHQQELIDRGKESLDITLKPQRDISHLTITGSRETLNLIAQRIAHLRAEILEIARLEKNPDRVLQCNFLVFPTAQKKSEQP